MTVGELKRALASVDDTVEVVTSDDIPIARVCPASAVSIDNDSIVRASRHCERMTPMPEILTTSIPRSLSVIASDIARNWPKPHFGAVPYLSAMRTLGSVNDNFGCDSGDSIVRYFLANATSWRGVEARRIKAELKSLLKGL